MEIAEWFVVISFFIAIFGFIIKEELELFILKIPSWQKWGSLVIFIILPFLIFFEDFASKCHLLNCFTFSWGIKPENIAFSIFYFLFVFLFSRIIKFRPTKKINEDIINLYIELLEEKQIKKFWKLFKKYEKYENYKRLNSNWCYYKDIILHPVFLENAVENESSFLLKFWNKFDDEKTFQKVLKAYLDNPNSAYYSEIKETFDANEITEDEELLIHLLDKKNLKESIRKDVIYFMLKYVIGKLEDEYKYGSGSIYNQRHNNYFENNLPIYYHIQFINLLFNNLISYQIDIEKIKECEHKKVNNIYSAWIKQIIRNLNFPEEWAQESMQPTYYHFLIDEMLENANSWSEKLNRKMVSKSDNSGQNINKSGFLEINSYVSFVPICLSVCFREIFENKNQNIFHKNYIQKKFHQFVLYDYFNKSINEKLERKIEELCIYSIPYNFIRPIFEYSLDKLDLSYENWLNEDYNYSPTIGEESIQKLKRLKENFIKRGNL